jgi:hypothetical protein
MSASQWNGYDNHCVCTNDNSQWINFKPVYFWLKFDINNGYYTSMGARTARSVWQLGYRLVKPGTILQFPAGTRESSLLQNIPTSSGDQPAS